MNRFTELGDDAGAPKPPVYSVAYDAVSQLQQFGG
ncbi:hypothetical protein HDG36_000221 [Paraburkholderia sp. Kb1A]|nr:hypothetical protein [Paraburkholderia sp. Kb1A]